MRHYQAEKIVLTKEFYKDKIEKVTSMPVERQVCQKCGHIFAAIEVNSITFHSPGRIMRISEDKICPICGGHVIWVSQNSTPLSFKRRIDDMHNHLKMSLLWGAVVLALLVLIFFIKYHLGL